MGITMLTFRNFRVRRLLPPLLQPVSPLPNGSEVIPRRYPHLLRSLQSQQPLPRQRNFPPLSKLSLYSFMKHQRNIILSAVPPHRTHMSCPPPSTVYMPLPVLATLRLLHGVFIFIFLPFFYNNNKGLSGFIPTQ